MRIVLLFGLFFSFQAVAQEGKKYFHNRWNDLTDNEIEAYYYEQWFGDDNNERRCYYTKGNVLKSIEFFQSNKKSGLAEYYHENGHLHFKARYINNEIVDTVVQFYPNGTLQYKLFYDSLDRRNPKEDKRKGYRILTYADSLGTIKVNNGNGVNTEYLESFKGFYIESGRVKNGLRDSIWIGHDPDGKQYFSEVWLSGTLQQGKSVDSEGNEFKYTTLSNIADPKGGMKSFYGYVGSSMKYPREARKAGIEGRVFLEFIVEKDGSISNVKIVRGIGAGCDEEALRVLNSSPKWNPGLQRGKPVRTKFHLAIIFKLS